MSHSYGGACKNGNKCDCSSFVGFVYKKFGITLPRTSGELCKKGKGVSKSAAPQGAILCAQGHVGLLCKGSGGNDMIHAANPQKGIVRGKSSWFSIKSARVF